MSGVVNTHESLSPSMWSAWALLGQLVGMGLSQACFLVSPKKASIALGNSWALWPRFPASVQS